jgi:hypothetical protein
MSKDYAAYASKEITPTMEAFHQWLQNETGLELDLRSVALAGSLRMDFQKSESWKSDPRNPVNSREANREARDQAKLEAAKKSIERAEARIAKLEAAAKDAKAKVAARKADAAKAKNAAKNAA